MALLFCEGTRPPKSASEMGDGAVYFPTEEDVEDVAALCKFLQDVEPTSAQDSPLLLGVKRGGIFGWILLNQRTATIPRVDDNILVFRKLIPTATSDDGSSRKRLKLEALPVVSGLDEPDFIQKLREGTTKDFELPELVALQSFIQKLPPGVLFPVKEKTYSGLSSASSHAKAVFRIAGPEDRWESSEWFGQTILDPPLGDDSEDSYHNVWDSLLYTPIFRFLGGYGVRKVRNEKGESTVGDLRCDVTYYLDGYALLKGQEKGPKTAGDPASELMEKHTWPYQQSIPYILGYYARAERVTLCALYRQQNATHKLDLQEFDLRDVSARIRLFVACFQIARLLEKLKTICIREGVEVDETISRPNGKEVELIGNFARKKYEDLDTANRVIGNYNRVWECPNVEVVLSKSQNKRTLLVSRGVKRRPVTLKELVECLHCTIDALVWLHERNFMHRDIRWDNVLQSRTDSSKWILIDFDDAACSPCSQGHPSLVARSHAPEMAGPHDVMVDIWGVGHLLQTSSTPLNSQLDWLMKKCLSLSPTDRPTALECKSFITNWYPPFLAPDIVSSSP